MRCPWCDGSGDGAWDDYLDAFLDCEACEGSGEVVDSDGWWDEDFDDWDEDGVDGAEVSCGE